MAAEERARHVTPQAGRCRLRPDEGRLLSLYRAKRRSLIENDSTNLVIILSYVCTFELYIFKLPAAFGQLPAIYDNILGAKVITPRSRDD